MGLTITIDPLCKAGAHLCFAFATYLSLEEGRRALAIEARENHEYPSPGSKSGSPSLLVNGSFAIQ